jgi:hypothetical protein
MMTDISTMTLRQLQTESARVLAAGGGYNNHELSGFNKLAHHDSRAWHMAVISWYVDQHGDLPSKIGPGAAVKLLMDVA